MQSMQNSKWANLLIGAFQADVKQQEVNVSIYFYRYGCYRRNTTFFAGAAANEFVAPITSKGIVHLCK
jgi:hypothetical protein